MTKSNKISWFLTKNASGKGLKLCYHADNVWEKCVWNKNIGFWTMLFLFCFYAYKIDKGNSDKMDIITKNLGSTSLQPCMTLMSASNSFEEI